MRIIKEVMMRKVLKIIGSVYNSTMLGVKPLIFCDTLLIYYVYIALRFSKIRVFHRSLANCIQTLGGLFLFYYSLSAFAAVVPNEATQELSRLLNSYRTYQASFNQYIYNKNGQLIQSSSGVVALARPGKFRWETLSPVHQIIIANGETLWIYDVDLAQAAKQKIGQRAGDPASLLTKNVESLLKQFFISKTVMPDRSIWFQLQTPIQNDAFQNLQIHFVDGQLTDIRMINSLRQTTVFHFSNILLNVELGEDFFTFEKPPQVKLLKQ
jgi:outer membrane lipoprotein carrier protein